MWLEFRNGAEEDIRGGMVAWSWGVLSGLVQEWSNNLNAQRALVGNMDLSYFMEAFKCRVRSLDFIR